MNITPLLVGGAALVIPVTCLIQSMRPIKANPAEVKRLAAWAIKLAKMPTHAIRGSLGPGRVDAKWTDNAWVSNIELARRAEVKTREQAAIGHVVEKVGGFFIRAAMVLFGIVLLFIAPALLIGAFFCGFIVSMLMAGAGVFSALAAHSAIKVGLEKK